MGGRKSRQPTIARPRSPTELGGERGREREREGEGGGGRERERERESEREGKRFLREQRAERLLREMEQGAHLLWGASC